MLVTFFLASFTNVSAKVNDTVTFFTGHAGASFLSLSLKFSATMVVCVSFTGLFTSSLRALTGVRNGSSKALRSALSFFKKVMLVLLVSGLVPRCRGPRRVRQIRRVDLGRRQGARVGPRLLHISMIATLILTVRGFPRNVIAFLTTLGSVGVTVPVTYTVTVRGVPRNVSISIPVCCTANGHGQTF